METLRLYKREKLCSVTAIDRLFASREEARAFLAYPLRAVWMENPSRGACAQFLISVPKKKLRHAVDRVTMRRRIREAYRLNRNTAPILAEQPLDIAFIYVSSRLEPYSRVEAAMKKILSKMQPQPAAGDEAVKDSL
ncbi:MAG: ribonuclease P protein component [Bacteroides sp.]|nr:ribonuclease P protein component [Bacteroides sp.]MCM1390021.1 ribonuclease P protein component [Bacteroides sp.]